MFSLNYGFSTWVVCDESGDLLMACESEGVAEAFIAQHTYYGA